MGEIKDRLKGNANQAIGDLKQQSDDLVVLGRVALVQSLMQQNLVEEYALAIHPLVLGSGRRLFPDGVPYSALKVMDCKTTTTGVLLTTCRPAS